MLNRQKQVVTNSCLHLQKRLPKINPPQRLNQFPNGRWKYHTQMCQQNNQKPVLLYDQEWQKLLPKKLKKNDPNQNLKLNQLRKVNRKFSRNYLKRVKNRQKPKKIPKSKNRKQL